MLKTLTIITTIISLSIETDLIFTKEKKNQIKINYHPEPKNFLPITKNSEILLLDTKSQNYVSFSNSEKNYIKFEMKKNFKYIIKFEGDCKIPLFYNIEKNENFENLKIIDNKEMEIFYINLGAIFLENLDLKKKIILEKIENPDFFAGILREQQIYVYKENRVGVIFCLNFEKKENLKFFLEWKFLENIENENNKISVKYLGNLITYKINQEIPDIFFTKDLFLEKNYTKIILIQNLKKITNLYIKEKNGKSLKIKIFFPEKKKKNYFEEYNQINFTKEFENVSEIKIEILNQNQNFSDFTFEFFTRNQKIQNSENSSNKVILVIFSIFIIILFIFGLILIFLSEKKKKKNFSNYEKKNFEILKINSQNLEKLNSSMNSENFLKNEKNDFSNDKNIISERIDLSYTSDSNMSSKSHDFIGNKKNKNY